MMQEGLNQISNTRRTNAEATVIEVDRVVTRFGSNTVHSGVSFAIPRGEIVALIGGSGSGKSVLLKTIIGLKSPDEGTVSLFGTNMQQCPEEQRESVRKRFGMLFQEGALFSALTVAQNVAAPLAEQLELDPDTIDSIVRLRVALAGLTAADLTKLPAELSGGMKKRAALARAIALEPELLFLDEPTSGLDPINARAFDELIHTLSKSLGMTVFMVTHDLDSILSVVDRVVVLSNGKVLANGSVEQVRAVDDAWLQDYFASRVGR